MAGAKVGELVVQLAVELAVELAEALASELSSYKSSSLIFINFSLISGLTAPVGRIFLRS